MRTFDQTMRAFLTASASSSPTPGGGSVAALAGALGAAMTSMVANLTQGEKFAAVEQEMRETVERMHTTIAEAEELLEADIASFDAYMQALKLPKTTEEEKAARSAALQTATVQATDVPLRLATLCRDALRHAQAIAAAANRNVISDLGIAAFLLEAAGQSALLTVDINLPGLQDASRRAAFEELRNDLQGELLLLKSTVVATVRERLG